MPRWHLPRRKAMSQPLSPDAIPPREQHADARGEILLAVARAAISSALGVPQTADESAPWLTEPGACFITLTLQGQLRGCIGSLEAHRSLLADIKSNAVSAALYD